MSTARRCPALRIAAALVLAGAVLPGPTGATAARMSAAAPSPEQSPAGTIEGRVVDPDGTALAGITVEALAARMERGTRVLVPAATVESDASGYFRLPVPEPAAYIVRAYARDSFQGGNPAVLRHGVTYYRGGSIGTRAAPVPVPPVDGTLRSITLVMLPARLATISGTVTAPSSRRLSSGSVTLTPLPIASPFIAAVPPVQIEPDGVFTFRGVLPGYYQIHASGETATSAPPLVASVGVLVQGEDIANLTLALGPCVAITGRVVAEAVAASPPPALDGLRVRAVPVDDSRHADARDVRVDRRGTFALDGIPPGTHHLVVEGLRPPWVLKSIVNRGQEVADVGVEMLPGQRFSDVAVTLVDVASEVTGVVKDEAGRPVPDGVVVLAAPAPRFWVAGSRRVAVARADGDGRYAVRGLPPGSYRAGALAGLHETDARLYAREFLEGVTTSGVPLDVRGTATSVLDVPLLPQALLRRELSR